MTIIKRNARSDEDRYLLFFVGILLYGLFA